MLHWRLMRWITGWLDRHGLGGVADILDAEVAERLDIEAMHALARRALARGDAVTAIVQLEKGLGLRPEDATLWCSLGAAHRHLHELDKARLAYEHALSLKPDYPQVLSNLGEWCIAVRRTQEALIWFDKALAFTPDFFEARLNMVAALFELGRYDDARTAAEKLVADRPERPEALLNLGNVLVHTGKVKQAIKLYQKALELQPGYVEAHFNLAALLGSREELANAIGYLERQIKERGESTQLLGFLAAAHFAKGDLDKSEELCMRIISRQEDNVMALITLGSCLSTGGNAAAALHLYEKVIRLDPNQPTMHSNVLFEHNNLPELGRERIFQRHREWAYRFEEPLRKPDDFTTRNRDPQRKLRIGYVSGDFMGHPVGFLLRDILRHHDASQFDIHCFSMVIRPQDVLPELRAAADHWEDIFFLGDEEVAELIRKAEIDILIDLSGHTAQHRLLVFARRPAPVQAEWIGYFHSTGMSAIDYFITDPHTTPPGSGQLFSETPVFLPHSRFCYGPPDYTPEVSATPCLQTGWITFGSFNRLPKMSDSVVAAWSKILIAVPTSRLIIKSGALSESLIKERLFKRFAAHGIDSARLDLRDRSAHGEMFVQYGEVDIALDTFPFNGGMTTLEALWMGVPVITIAGDTVVSRQTVAALANLELASELAFSGVDAYVNGAVALANNPDRLSALRNQLRPRMMESPLRQAEQFAHDLE
jgi:protein O-GlcNAc transferase